MGLELFEGTSIGTWLASCFEVLSKKNVALLLFVGWFVWKERNQRVWSNRFVSLTHLQFQIRSSFMLVQSHLVTTRRTSGRIRPVWSPPSSGWLKANCDGAFDLLSKSGGIGVVIRDALGDIVGGACIKVNSVASPEAIEAMACRAACSLAVQYHLSPIIFETDCQHLVSSVESGAEETSALGRVIEDINSFLQVLVGSSLRHVYREANTAAHNLAKLALLSSFNLSWSGHVPPDIRSFIASQCTH
ncbi:putative ribonuclease H-like domain-containing protein [Rosa chinensis]|uniref:Putative ribonuclease H-like domain-containing protein n=1 Tax=Rosa chinensis TaxID=74649 RepID=A0A2P6Q531_ROSCH|nr:putative ribonuclease H-like domain-containing protein [Rosa chinensis]